MKFNLSAAALLVVVCFAIGVFSQPGFAQIAGSRVPGGCDAPAAQRTKEIGCYLTATEVLKQMPEGDPYWHLYQYPTRVAADAAKPRDFGTVTESLGKIWLYVIAEKAWQPKSGNRIAVIGPLKVNRSAQYTARYMEAVFSPGMQTSVHTHSGPEAWYILSGVQCLQTPDSQSISRAGDGAVVPMGPPMMLTSLGTETRRSVALVLHDSGQPWMTIDSQWKPDKPCEFKP